MITLMSNPMPGGHADAAPARVLVIDDEQSVREMFRRSLLLAGFDVAVASGGAEGLKMLGTDAEVGLVMLDLDMPYIDGRRFREAQRSDPRLAAIPTVIVTGTPITDGIRDTLQASDYLSKPVGRAQLLSVVGKYCGTQGE